MKAEMSIPWHQTQIEMQLIKHYMVTSYIMLLDAAKNAV